MSMMDVEAVRMAVRLGRMPMNMGMFALDGRIVDVVVMTVVVPMDVLVHELSMRVRVLVALAEGQPHCDAEQSGCDQRGPARGPIPKKPRHDGSDEGRHAEDRAGPPSPNHALRMQVQAQAQAIAGEAASKEGNPT